jgi:hypothetical protein
MMIAVMGQMRTDEPAEYVVKYSFTENPLLQVQLLARNVT